VARRSRASDVKPLKNGKRRDQFLEPRVVSAKGELSTLIAAFHRTDGTRTELSMEDTPARGKATAGASYCSVTVIGSFDVLDAGLAFHPVHRSPFD